MADVLEPQEGDVIVVWFSCGAASAVALKETIRRYGKLCTVLGVNNPLKEEHPDNRRFGADVAAWTGSYIEWFTNPKWPTASARDVWHKERFMSGPHGAPCTRALKRGARLAYEETHRVDWHVLGFTADEKHRYDRFVASERPNTLPVLIEAGFTKADCMRRLTEEGIRLPEVYALGYPNANCLGCVKATAPAYWNHVRKTHPEVFADRAAQSREIGARLVEVGKKRIFLDELDPNEKRGRPLKSYTVECGVWCGTEYWRDAS